MSLVECGLHGQAYLAGGALSSYLDDEHYLKVSCTAGRRTHPAELAPVQSTATLSSARRVD